MSAAAWEGEADARRTFALLAREPGDVLEVRALGVRRGGRTVTVSGYFDNAEAFVEAARSLDGISTGVYVTLNPVNPALLARVSNRLVDGPKSTTNDKEVHARRAMFIDFDPVRPTGISATEAEKDAAFDVLVRVVDYLNAAGFPPPILADSGNGWHLVYLLDLPADDGGLVHRVLEALSAVFSTPEVAIDTTVGNPARIVKLYGTLARKGDSTPDRPHRRSVLSEIPKAFRVVPVELLRALALPEAPAPRANGTRGLDAFDVPAFLVRHGIDVLRTGPWQDGTRWVLSVCPWNPAHTDGSAVVLQFRSGAVDAMCQHDGCKGRGWRDLREMLEPAALRTVVDAPTDPPADATPAAGPAPATPAETTDDAARLALKAVGFAASKAASGPTAAIRPVVFKLMEDLAKALPPDGGAPAARAVPWRTIAEILAWADAHPRDWLLDRILSFGSVALLFGTGKVAGKSTLSWAILGHALRGEDLYGRQLAGGKVKAVILSEETEADLADKIRAFGIDPKDDGLSILTVGSMRPRLTWAEVGRLALDRCRETGARILLVDTWAKWTRMPGSDENPSGPTLEALDIVEPARQEGILVLLLHHPSKAEGREGGNAARGSSALPGEVDVSIELRNGRDAANPTRRTLHVESRASGVFDLVVSYVPAADGRLARFEEVGEVAAVDRDATDVKVLAFVKAKPGATGRQIQEGAKAREGDVQRALPRLAATGHLDRRGKGRAGSPYRYWPKGCAPAEDVSDVSRPAPAQGDTKRSKRRVSDTPTSPPIGGDGVTETERSGAGNRRPAATSETAGGGELFDTAPDVRQARHARDEGGRS